MPHVAKVERGGEDAFFVTHTGVCALGVTDGVGGWAADGVDVAEYARGICDRASEAIERSRGSIGEPDTHALTHIEIQTHALASGVAPCMVGQKGTWAHTATCVS